MSKSSVFIPNFEDYDPSNLKSYMNSILSHIQLDQKIVEQLRSNIENAPHAKEQDLQELKKAAIIFYIISQIPKHGSEIIKGAHVMVSDNGAIYDELVTQGLVGKRVSSHHKKNKDPDYGDVSMQGGEIFREFLLGKTLDGKTWFQTEAHSVGGWGNILGHAVDFVRYQYSKQNIGQYGTSRHLDSNPIEIRAWPSSALAQETLGRLTATPLSAAPRPSVEGSMAAAALQDAGASAFSALLTSTTAPEKLEAKQTWVAKLKEEREAPPVSRWFWNWRS
jgi:hypothetical protein